ncbi:MAG: hypothetical protein WBH04_11195, partial [Albidovulum sp.]
MSDPLFVMRRGLAFCRAGGWHLAHQCRVMAVLAVFGLAGSAVAAQEMSGLAILDGKASVLRDDAEGLAIDLVISQPAPYRISFLEAPYRLVVDFQEVEFAKADPASVNRSSRVVTMSWGKLRPGWSRLVAVLDAPMRLETAQMEGRGAGGATIKLRLSDATREEFAQAVAQSDA